MSSCMKVECPSVLPPGKNNTGADQGPSRWRAWEKVLCNASIFAHWGFDLYLHSQYWVACCLLNKRKGGGVSWKKRSLIRVELNTFISFPLPPHPRHPGCFPGWLLTLHSILSYIHVTSICFINNLTKANLVYSGLLGWKSPREIFFKLNKPWCTSSYQCERLLLP